MVTATKQRKLNFTSRKGNKAENKVANGATDKILKKNTLNSNETTLTENGTKSSEEMSSSAGIHSYADLRNVLHTVDPQWKDFLEKEFSKPYFQKILDRLTSDEKQGMKIYPPPQQVFSLFEHCSFDNVKVVILGQDPYHKPNQAHGLCFSVNKGITIPPSLRNMYKELATDIPDFKAPNHGYLKGWVDQGVFLLNAVLTVKESTPNYHKDIGWETFTTACLKYLSDRKSNLVFIFWGNYAQKAGKCVDSKKHLVLKGAHPSPLSAKKFFGCNHFSKTNAYLAQRNKSPIEWSHLI